MEWITGLQKAIDYIEDNLTETIDYNIVAAQSFSSVYHFQRIFSILCGFTIGEYIRDRRLTLAGAELISPVFLPGACQIPPCTRLPWRRLAGSVQ